jgi:hypothetical protein
MRRDMFLLLWLCASGCDGTGFLGSSEAINGNAAGDNGNGSPRANPTPTFTSPPNGTIGQDGGLEDCMNRPDTRDRFKIMEYWLGPCAAEIQQLRALIKTGAPYDKLDYCMIGSYWTRSGSRNPKGVVYISEKHTGSMPVMFTPELADRPPLTILVQSPLYVMVPSSLNCSLSGISGGF